MKKVLVFTAVHSGAGTVPALLDFEDGTARNGQATWTAPRMMGIVSVTPMTAGNVAFTIQRGSHVGDDVTVPCLGDTLADDEKTIDLMDLLGAGLVVESQEIVNFLSVASGAATVTIVVVLDDVGPFVNARCPRVAGATVAGVNIPTETGANIRAALSASSRYTWKALFGTSTTVQSWIVRWTGKPNNFGILLGANAIAGGQSNYVKAPIALTELGSDYNTDFQLDILATAADAAAVQDLFLMFTTN